MKYEAISCTEAIERIVRRNAAPLTFQQREVLEIIYGEAEFTESVRYVEHMLSLVAV
jgi:hypothetical protein